MTKIKTKTVTGFNDKTLANLAETGKIEGLAEKLIKMREDLNSGFSQSMVDEGIQKRIDDGTIANIAIENGSLTYEKFSESTINNLEKLCVNTVIIEKNLYKINSTIEDSKEVTGGKVVEASGKQAVRVKLNRKHMYMVYGVKGNAIVKNTNGDVIHNVNIGSASAAIPLILSHSSLSDIAYLWFNYTNADVEIYDVNSYRQNEVNETIKPYISKEKKERTNNIFDKDRVYYGAQIENSNANVISITNNKIWIGNIAEVSSTDVIYSNQLIRVLTLDKDLKPIKKKSISAGASYDLSTITEGTPVYMLIGCDSDSNDINSLMVSKSPITSYEPYYKETNSVKINQYYIADYKTDTNTYDDAILEIFSKIRANKANENSGAEVIFSEGVYELSPRVLPQRTKFVGRGIGITVLKAKDGSSGDFITVADTSKFSGISGMSIWGNKNNANVNGIVFKMSGYPTHDYTEVYDKTNVNATTYFYSKYHDILVVDCKGDGVIIGFRYYLLNFDNVYTYGCDGYGIYDKGTDNFFSNIVTERSGKSGIYESGGNNKWTNVKSIWNGKLVVDGEAGIKIKDTMRVQMSNVECQDNYCNGYHLENVQAVMISNGLADGNGRILGAENVEGFCGNPDCMGLYMKGVTASKIDMHFDNYKNPTKYQNKAYFIDQYGTYDNQYNFTERRQNVPMVLKQQYCQYMTCDESNIPYPADMYRGKTLLYYSESEGRDKVCICVKKNSTEYEWKEI